MFFHLPSANLQEAEILMYPNFFVRYNPFSSIFGVQFEQLYLKESFGFFLLLNFGGLENFPFL